MLIFLYPPLSVFSLFIIRDFEVRLLQGNPQSDCKIYLLKKVLCKSLVGTQTLQTEFHRNISVFYWVKNDYL